MVRYRETLELKVPLFVLRGLVAAAEFGLDSHKQTDADYWVAIKWLADRPIYREQCLTDELVEAVYQRQTHEATP
jgi:hypothetical protein